MEKLVMPAELRNNDGFMTEVYAAVKKRYEVAEKIKDVKKKRVVEKEEVKEEEDVGANDEEEDDEESGVVKLKTKAKNKVWASKKLNFET